MFVSTFKPGHLAKFFEQIPVGEFHFTEEVVEVMRAFERVSKSIWELKNKLNAYYSEWEPFHVEFDDTKKENVLVLKTDSLKMFFYYSDPQLDFVAHMKLNRFGITYLR